MNEREWFQIAAYVGLLISFAPLLGGFIARVFSGERTFLTRLFSPVERWIYRLAGCDPKAEMRWTSYAVALLIFNLCGFLAVFGLQLLQEWLPLNPQKFTNVPLRSRSIPQSAS